MKKSSLFLGIFAILLSTNLKAQHELKTNVLGLLIGQYGLTYEYVLEKDMGIQGGITYFTSPSSFSYDYTAIAFTPEFRYYFNPDDGADGFFASGYLKYRNTSADEYISLTLDDGNGNITTTTIGQTTNGLALGVATGGKWVTRSGFLFEAWLGFGRYLIDAESYTNGYDPDADNSILGDVTGSVDDLPAWDLRLGLTVGWRFGG